MRTMPAGIYGRSGINAQSIYVRDLIRRVESLMDTGQYTPRSQPGVPSPVRFPVNTVASEFFEDY
jgi:hypothetical protein